MIGLCHTWAGGREPGPGSTAVGEQQQLEVEGEQALQEGEEGEVLLLEEVVGEGKAQLLQVLVQEEELVRQEEEEVEGGMVLVQEVEQSPLLEEEVEEEEYRPEPEVGQAG